MSLLYVRRWLALWGVLLVVAPAATVHAQSSATPAAQLDATDAYRLAILEMKGELSVGRALLQLREPGADYFLHQPMREIFERAKAEFERRNAPFTADFLKQLANVSQGDAVRALATIESAANALDGSIAQTGAMNAGSVIGLADALLREAVTRYATAVTDNEVTDLRAYQSGRGLATEAEALVRYSGALRGRAGHETLLKVVTLIRQAWPGIIPPPIVFDPPSVMERLDQAVAIMDEMR